MQLLSADGIIYETNGDGFVKVLNPKFNAPMYAITFKAAYATTF